LLKGWELKPLLDEKILNLAFKIPKKLVIVLSLMTFTGVFILILIGAWLKEKAS